MKVFPNIGRTLFSRLALASTALALSLGNSTALFAQSLSDSVQTPRGMCRIWTEPHGGGNAPDWSYRRCALDRIPSLLPGAVMPPAPFEAPAVGGSFFIVVNADGTVDPRLTRDADRLADTVFQRVALETIKQWRFDPGIRQGVPVRSAFFLYLVEKWRNDTLPSRLEWSYKPGLDADSLGTAWITEAPLPPFAPEQLDSVYLAMLRRLVQMQVLMVPPSHVPYCLVAENGDPVLHARLSRLASGVLNPYRSLGGFAPYGCERSTSVLRIIFPRVHRTENGRAVLSPSGDFLPNWPLGFDGHVWRTWSSKCVAKVPEQGSVWINCPVGPELMSAEYGAWQRERERARAIPRASVPVSSIDSLRLTVLVTMRDAYRIDTLHAVVRGIPRLTERALIDSNPPCRSSWAAYSPQDSAQLYLFSGDTDGAPLAIATVLHRAAPASRAAVPRCGPQTQALTEFTAFLIGGIGDRATVPITLCIDRCAKSYVIDPSRHTMIERPHLTFRLADLRPDTRVGDELLLRINTDPLPASILSIVAIRSRNGPPRVWIGRPLPSSWDYRHSFDGSYPPDTEVQIYLIAR